RDVVEDQHHAVVDIDGAVVELGVAVDRAVGGDVNNAVRIGLVQPRDRAVAGQQAVVDGAAVDCRGRQRQGGVVVDLDDAGQIGVGDLAAGHRDVVEDQHHAGVDVDRAVGDAGLDVARRL